MVTVNLAHAQHHNTARPGACCRACTCVLGPQLSPALGHECSQVKVPPCQGSIEACYPVGLCFPELDTYIKAEVSTNFSRRDKTMLATHP